jgi:hypothetical protein
MDGSREASAQRECARRQPLDFSLFARSIAAELYRCSGTRIADERAASQMTYRFSLFVALACWIAPRAVTAQTPEPAPEGRPPPLRVSDPDWYDTEQDDGAEEPDSLPNLHRNLGLGAQWFFVQDKIMPGLELRGGKDWIWGHFETSFLFSTESSPVLDSSALGNQFGLYASLSPLNSERVEVHLGLGMDVYWLWGIHGDQGEIALSTRASGHYWFSRQFGAFASARWYPVSSDGLELGTTREGDAGIPVLFALGLEWRPR